MPRSKLPYSKVVSPETGRRVRQNLAALLSGGTLSMILIASAAPTGVAIAVPVLLMTTILMMPNTVNSASGSPRTDRNRLMPSPAGRPPTGRPDADNSFDAPASSAHETLERMLDHAVLRFDYGLDGRLTRVNAKTCIVTGYHEAELVGSRLNVLQPGLEGTWTGALTELEPDGLWTGVAAIDAKDGTPRWLSCTVAAVRGSDHRITGYCCIAVDVTEAHHAREESRRHSKLMQLGQLTATVAHEIRNPLGAIRTASFVLERKIKGQIEGVGPQLDRINAGIQRCDKIITELLDVSRVKALKTQRLDIDKWVASTVAEDCHGLAGNPEIRLELGLDGTEASFDPDQMRQVIINLLNNAAEATAEKARAAPNFIPVVKIATHRTGNVISITVTDNGPGIEPKHLQRIREPLFTTKSFGVGLGISAMERILENHGGQLSISSVYGQGATLVASFAGGDVAVSASKAAA